MVGIPIGIVIGFVGWFMLRYIVTSFYTVNQNERAVKTSFGRAQRLGPATTLALPMAEALRPDERERYSLAAVARDPTGWSVFQVAMGARLQSLHRHGDHQHGAGYGRPERQ